MLQMLRRVGDRDAAALRKGFDSSLALGNEFEQFKAMLVAERFGNGCNCA